jgi:ribonuclease J
MTVQIIIHRGTREIGGNCVEVATANTRIIIDVGMPLVDENGESFDARSLQGKEIPELLEAGVLPKVPGLFRDPQDTAASPDAILLSHAHSDHTGLLKYTRRETPVWLSPGTSDMMYVGLKFAGQSGVSQDRQRQFTPGDPFTIGDFSITAYPVDHSAFDSMAFLIEAEGRRVLYTGDLRLHGRKPGMARQLVEAAAAKQVHVVVMEGTHVGPENKNGITESDLEKELIEHMVSARGLVLANFSPLHVDRLVGFYRATISKPVGRTFVIDPYAAMVMQKARQRCKIPDPAQTENIWVYFNHAFEKTWEKKCLGSLRESLWGRRITMDEIRATPERFVMIFRPSMVPDDFQGSLPKHSRCIYSYWSGYLKQPCWTELQAKLASPEVEGDFIKAHTSGHIFAEDIVDFIERIDPREMMQVIPIHTFYPDEFPKLVARVEKLEDGRLYSIP